MAKRGSIIPKGEKKYLVRVFKGRDGSGKRRYVSRMINGTIAQAKRELTALLTEVDTNAHVVPTKTTVEEFLRDHIENKPGLSKRTRRDYGDRMRLCVYPELGMVKLQDLDAQQVERFYAKLLASGLSPRTVRYVHAILSGAMKKAVKWGVLRSSPCNAVELPKQKKVERPTLSREQIATLFKTTEGTFYYAMWHLLIGTGLRPQEALALKWTDIEGDWVTIHRALVKTDKPGQYEIGTPKTKASMRTIGLGQTTLKALKAHRKITAARELLSGVRTDFIFANQEGNPLDHTKVGKAWKAALKKAGIPHIRLYDGTRHTHATELIRQGADLRWVQARLGHTDIQTTAQNYAHVRKEVHREMGAMTDAIFAVK